MLVAVSSSRGICHEGVVRKPKVVLEDFLKLALSRTVNGRLSEASSEKSYLNEMAAVWLAMLGPRL